MLWYSVSISTGACGLPRPTSSTEMTPRRDQSISSISGPVTYISQPSSRALSSKARRMHFCSAEITSSAKKPCSVVVRCHGSGGWRISII